MSLSSDVNCSVSVLADFAESDLSQLSTTTTLQTVQLASSGDAVLTAPNSVDGKIFTVKIAGYAHLTVNSNQTNINLLVNGNSIRSVTPHNGSSAATLPFFMETKCYWSSGPQVILNYATPYAETVSFETDPAMGNVPNNINSITSASQLTFKIQASVNSTDAGSYLHITEFRIIAD